MKRKKSIVAALLLASLMMTGCAENQIPDLTQEQVQDVGEYVAMVLKKYDIGRRSRLMDLSAYEQQWENDNEQEAVQPPAGMSPVDDTPVVNAPEVEAPAVTSYSMEEVMGLPEGCGIVFTGSDVCSYYPEAGEDLFFSLNASEGRKLLVLNFSITNTSAQEQSVNLLSSDITYRITVNGDYTRRALTTMLDNDLSVYSGSLAAGGTAEAVLIIEVEEAMADSITSAELSLKRGEISSLVTLF